MDPTGEDGTQAHPNDALPTRLVSVNDVVSMNLAHFRKASGLSQQELADKIGWLKSVVSTAERSWEARRKRNFTAGDLIDIAYGLGIPVAALLLPPEDDGTAVTYVVDGLHGADQQPLRNFLPMVMPNVSTYAGASAAEKEFRRRLLATGRQRPHPLGAKAEEEAKQRIHTARELIRLIAERAVAAAGGDPATVEQVEREATRQADGNVALLLNVQAQLERQVDELRSFEREYRSRLRRYIEDQYRAFWAGTEGADPDQLLSAMRDQAVGRPHVITVPAAGARDDKAPEDALLVELPAEARRLGLAGARDLRSRGIPGPYMIKLAADGSVTVTAPAADESVRVEKEVPDEGQRLPAVLLPRPGDEEAARP